MSRQTFLAEHFELEDGKHPSVGLTKHKKMTLSPFVFFRGSAPLFYADIASGIQPLPHNSHDLPIVYVMGDCHLSNFGFFNEEGSHSHKVIFAPNDFDDACAGNPVWDLVRFCTSIHLSQYHCSMHKDEIGKPIATIALVEQAISQFLQSYLEQCLAVLDNPLCINDAIEWIEPGSKLHKLFLKAQRRAVREEDFETKSTLAKATQFNSDNRLCFAHLTEKFVHISAKEKNTLTTSFAPYMDDTIHDVVKRVGAGTGSVNLSRYYFLIGPKTERKKPNLAHFHIVEVKQQKIASPLRYQLIDNPINTLNPAHLTARCQRFMQRNPDLLLDEAIWDQKHWLVRSRHHAKVGVEPEDIMVGKKNLEGGLGYFASLCGKALALAHCRSERRGITFEHAFVSRSDTLITDIADTAEICAERTFDDYQLFCKLVK